MEIGKGVIISSQSVVFVVCKSKFDRLNLEEIRVLNELLKWSEEKRF